MASDEFRNDLAVERHDERDDEPDPFDDAMDAADQAWKERDL